MNHVFIFVFVTIGHGSLIHVVMRPTADLILGRE